MDTTQIQKLWILSLSRISSFSALYSHMSFQKKVSFFYVVLPQVNAFAKYLNAHTSSNYLFRHQIAAQSHSY